MKRLMPYRLSLIRNLTLFIIMISSMIFAGCKGSSEKNKTSTQQDFITDSKFLLNTMVTINLYDKQDQDILDGCFSLIEKYENIFSRTKETSELYALNHRTAPRKDSAFRVSDELAVLLKKSLYYCELTNGAFDITIEPLSSQWDFTAHNPVLPDKEEIEAALPYVGYQNVHLKDNSITFASDQMGIDLGAVAKGYIADKVKEYLKKEGVYSAMINLGGNVLCIGSKPDGTPFHVGIQKPFANRNETIAIMDISDLSVVSSGVYERYFEVDGIAYHHILDPTTGYPYESDLVSVTIISEKSVDGDCLSTSCFALGLEKGLELIADIEDTYAVFITKDYEIFYSQGFQESISINKQ